MKGVEWQCTTCTFLNKRVHWYYLAICDICGGRCIEQESPPLLEFGAHLKDLGFEDTSIESCSEQLKLCKGNKQKVIQQLFDQADAPGADSTMTHC